MKPGLLIHFILPLASMLMYAGPAAAAASGKPFGDKSCRFFIDEADRVSDAKWNGPCKNELAEGEGILQWRDKNGETARYEGGMLGGHRHGAAYIKFENGDQFDGRYQNGKRDGKGVLLEANGTEYDGEWKEGREHGQGWRKYSTGGRYDGQWKDGKFHGTGKAVYIGGQTYEGQFNDGTPADGRPAAPTQDASEYRLDAESVDHRSLERLKKPELSSSSKGLPFSATYDQLTPAQRQSARSAYPMLHDTDEPPYPAGGIEAAARWMSKIQSKVLVQGPADLYLHVGSDGNVTAVNIVRAPTPELGRIASVVMMSEKFKPGVCAGKACPMVYPIRFAFTLE